LISARWGIFAASGKFPLNYRLSRVLILFPHPASDDSQFDSTPIVRKM
jgi:hypothetical protein